MSEVGGTDASRPAATPFDAARRGPVIDPVVNVANAWTAKVEFTRRAEREVFRASDDYSRDLPADDMVAILDAAGVERAIVGIDPEDPVDWILDYVRRYPDRFALAAEPRLKHGLDAVWATEDLARAHPVVAVRAAPMFHDRPATDAFYYPLYAKCIELDVPVCMTTGMPGPPGLPAYVQHPQYVDRVLLDLPRLHFVMLHGADPWWAEAIRLLRRHPNLTMCTSAWPPSRLPPELVRFLRGRGSDKVLFGSDFPVLPVERCVREARELDLPDEVRHKYLYANAERVFFGPRHPRHA